MLHYLHVHHGNYGYDYAAVLRTEWDGPPAKYAGEYQDGMFIYQVFVPM